MKKYNKITNYLIMLLLCVLPFERLITFEAFGFTLKLSYVIGIVLLIYVFLFVRDKIKLDFADRVLGLFVGWSFITTLWSDAPSKTIIYSGLYLLFYLIYLAIKNYSDKNVDKYLKLTIFIGVLLSIFSLWQYFGDSFGLSDQLTFLRPEYQKGVFAFPRVQATFLEPLYYANYLVIALIFSVLSFIKSQTKKEKLEYGFTLILIALSLFLTLSRGGIVAAGIGVTLFLAAYLIRFKDIKKTAQLVILFVVSIFLTFALICAVSGQKGVKDYATQSQKTTDTIVGENVPATEQLRTRESTSEVAKEEISNHWVTGIGTKAFGSLPDFALLREKGNYQTVNNQYLEVLVEMGIVGISLFLIFWMLCVKQIFVKFLKNKDLNSLAFLAIIISWLAQYMTFSSFWLLYIWVYLAVFVIEE